MNKKAGLNKKKFSLVLLATFALGILTYFIWYSNFRIDNQQGEEQNTMIPIDKFNYAFMMRFSVKATSLSDGERIVGSLIWWGHRPYHADLIFVHSEAEATGFPDDVIVAWPEEHSKGIVAGINWAVTLEDDEIAKVHGSQGRPVVNLEDFGLTYPLTVTDLVDNWEKVLEVWNSLVGSEQDRIWSNAPHGGPVSLSE